MRAAAGAVTERNFALSGPELSGSIAEDFIELKIELNESRLRRAGKDGVERKFPLNAPGLPGCGAENFIEFNDCGDAGGAIELRVALDGVRSRASGVDDVTEPNFGLSADRGFTDRSFESTIDSASGPNSAAMPSTTSFSGGRA
jgi:hypothetical protein